jgi:hypothetical protein
MTKITKEDELHRRRAAENAKGVLDDNPPMAVDTDFEGQDYSKEPRAEDLPPSAKVSPMETQMYPNSQPVGAVGVPIAPIDPEIEESEEEATAAAKKAEPDAAKAAAAAQPETNKSK